MSKTEDRGLLGSLAATIYAGATDKHTPASAVDVAAQILAAVDAKIAGGPEPAAAAAAAELPAEAVSERPTTRKK